MPYNEIYQYSLVNALMSGVSDSGITVGQFIEKGNVGLGTFVKMRGELVLLDGKVYQLQAEGSVRVAEPEEQIPYAVCTNFKAQDTVQVTLDTKDSVDEILEKFNNHASNLFMAYRIEGVFKKLKCRTVKGQEYDGQVRTDLMALSFSGTRR